MQELYDLIVVGGGPAGLTAALYAGRSKIKTLVVEKQGIGSLYMSHKIDNYPGFPEGITGKELNTRMRDHAKKFGVEFAEANLLGFDFYGEDKIVKTDSGNYKAKNVIIATGTGKNFSKKLPGEEEFLGRGVSYCATCDGAFTKGLVVSLIGKGEEVAEEALFLTKFSKSIQLFITDTELKCEDDTKKAILESEKITILPNIKLLEIKGNEFVEELVVEENDIKKTYKTDFAFLYLGTKNNIEMYGEIAKLDEEGYIITNDNLQMNFEGTYAVGDIRACKLKQITIAVADGTRAALEVIKRVLKR